MAITNGLRIGKNFVLPPEAVTETFAIIAKRGMGKTYLSADIAEEMIENGHQVCIVDPIGVWWGLRSSADGKSAGLPVVILGGDHGDAPLEATAGAVIADFVVDNHTPVILDLSMFRKGEQTRFMTDFGERLYHRNRQPLHLILDEADAFAPQRPLKGQERMLGAMEDLVRRGRARGIGVTLITQRSAVLNKDVLTQAEVLVALRVTSPQDRKAVDEWIKLHVGEDLQRDEFLSSLPSLPVGEAWFWSPGWLDVFQRVKVRARKTFDSSATPKVGQRRAEPKAFAEIDIEALAGRIAETIEKAKADDPKELRRRIARLEKEIAGHQCPEAPEVVEMVEVPAVTEENLRHLNAAVVGLRTLTGQLTETADKIHEQMVPARSEHEHLIDESRSPKPLKSPKLSPINAATVQQNTVSSNGNGSDSLGKGERNILNILAQWPEGRTHNELAFLAGYSAKASTVGGILAKLRRMGLVEQGQPIRPTADGLVAAGGPQSRPSGPELLAHWHNHPRMGEGERRVLNVLVDHYPAALSHDDLCEKAGYSPNASTVGGILSKLRKLGLVEKHARQLDADFAASIT